jgi:hypothetical protein
MGLFNALFLLSYGFDHYNEIAPTGHSSTQTPHEMHSSLIFALPSTIEIASTGHTLTHALHPVHFSSSTTAFIKTPSFKKISDQSDLTIVSPHLEHLVRLQGTAR